MDPTVQRWLADCLSPNNLQRLVQEDNNDDSSVVLPLHFSPVSPPQPLRLLLPPPNHNNDDDNNNFQEEREQALRDYKVTIEYKHLKSHAPGGVYLVPSLHDLRLFYGVIFVRRGPFTNGIFKFEMKLPLRYNDFNAHPEIKFSSYVYNPYVDPETGLLDLKTTYPNWDPAKHYLVTVLTFLKKIFYAKSFEDAAANQEAQQLFATDATAYREKVDECVRVSQIDVYDDNNNPDNVVCRFTEEELGHRVLRDLLKANIKDPAQVSKTQLLSMIQKASNV